MTPFCNNCGYKIEEAWNNCPECGVVLREQKIYKDSQSSPTSKPINQPTYQPMAYPKTSGNIVYGIVALFCGIVGLFVYFWLFGTLAITFGAVGQKKDTT